MINSFDNEWTAEIPSYEITTAGIEYYIFATDGVNNATQPMGSPYSVNVEGEGAEEEDFTFFILLVVIIAIVSLILIMLFLRQKKRKGEPAREEHVMVEPMELS